MKSYPMSNKDDMVAQLISTRKKFPTYKSHGAATVDDIWSKQDRQDAIEYHANDMHTSYIQNNGNGKFIIKPLPLQVQTAPVFAMISKDVNGDENLDVLLTGNDYGKEPYSGRHDAFNGLCLTGDGKGNFKTLSINESGFFIKGDGKALSVIHNVNGKEVLIATQNQDSVLAFTAVDKSNEKGKVIKLLKEDFSAVIKYKNGTKQYAEFYYGSTYLSQSSRTITLSNDVKEITITDFKTIKE